MVLICSMGMQSLVAIRPRTSAGDGKVRFVDRVTDISQR